MDFLSTETINALNLICPNRVFTNVDLSKISQWKIGGNAKLFIQAYNTAEVSALRRFFCDREIKHVAIGKTTNILFSDDGLEVPCIQIVDHHSAICLSGNTLRVDAGVWVPRLSYVAMKASLTGIEHICGIPGALGGLIYMNGGTKRKGIGEVVSTVESVADDGTTMLRNNDDCHFGYRESVFQSLNEVITRVELNLTEGVRSISRSDMIETLKDRNRKFPRRLPNCGSVFKSNPIFYAEHGPPGLVIEKLGFKGLKVGGAVVSLQHANFIVNDGGATSNDVRRIISIIKDSVLKATGLSLEAEARYINQYGVVYAADHVLDGVNDD